MDKVSLEFVRFENSDVIATSGTPDLTPVIWVEASSLDNYNAMAKANGHYELLNMLFSGKTYLQYNGAIFSGGYLDVKGQDTTEGINYIYHVDKDDTNTYNVIHDWLTAQQQ